MQKKESKRARTKFHFQNDKAGMEEVNKDKINQIIKTAMAGSSYYQRQEEKKQSIDQEVQQLKLKLEQELKDPNIGFRRKQFKNLMQEVKQELDLSRYWLHVDLDMFYVACEIRDNPSLADKPVGVGITLLATSNYIARKFGVRSAMPTFIAKRLCPDLVVLPVNMPKYRAASKKFMNILREYDPDLESLGSDEGRLDITEYLKSRNINSEEEISKLMKNIRERIFAEIGVTASAGCSVNKMLSKLSSEKNKPNGQFIMPKNKSFIENFIGELSVRKIPGVGPKTEHLLEGMEIKTGLQLRSNLFKLFLVMRDTTFEFLARRAYGVSTNFHEEVQDRKSISCSRTFRHTHKYAVLQQIIRELAEEVASKAQREKFKGRGISISVKTSDFRIKQKSKKLDKYINLVDDIFREAKILFKQSEVIESVRLLGIRLDDLIPEEKLKNSLFSFFEKKEFKRKNDGDERNYKTKEDFLEERGMEVEEIILEEREKIKENKALKKEFSDFGTKNIDVISLESSHESFEGYDTNLIKEIEEHFEETTPTGRENLGKETEISESSILSRKKDFMKQTVVCPACCKELETHGNYMYFNRHLDKCLLRLESKGEEDNQTASSGMVSNNISAEIRPERPKRRYKKRGRKRIKTNDGDGSSKGSLFNWIGVPKE